MGVQLGGSEALVAGEAAAVDAFRDHHFASAAPDDIDQALGLAQVLSAAGDMHGDRLLLWGELQPVEQVLADELHRIVQLKARVEAVL